MFKNILFDLDGTLLDTNELIIKSFKHTYHIHLKREVPEEEILENFGEPLITTLERYSKEDAKAMFKTYVDFNETIHDQYVKAFPGAKECLESLKEAGCRIALVTSKRRALAEHGLELFDLLKYFDVTVGLEDTTKHKPHPEPILLAMEKLGCIDDKESAIMIGDSKFDILSAEGAGIRSVLVNWSKAQEAQGENVWKPDFVIEDLLSILSIVNGERNV